jgi:rhodanese-related sulfurtransferase
MSKQAIQQRLLFPLVCLSTIVLVGGCSGQKSQPPASPVTSARQDEAEFDIRPVLADFFAKMPEDWREIPAASVAKSKPFVVDVREQAAYKGGFIEGALNIPLRELTASLPALPPLDREIAVVSDTGHRGAIGMAILQMLGYKNAVSLQGGMQSWRAAKLPVVTSPVPERPSGQAPQVNEQLRTVLDYYLRKTLPFDDGALTLAGLTQDQNRKSSAELEPTADTYDQGRALLVDVDTPAEFAKARLFKTVNVPLREFPGGVDKVAVPDVIGWACGVPDAYKPEPKLTRFVVVSTSAHRASLGMIAMQMLGYHFVGALDDNVSGWKPVGPVAIAD